MIDASDILPFLDENHLSEVLVVSGDHTRETPRHTLKIIEQIKTHDPQRKVYAALDPYREHLGGMNERENVRRKLSA